MMNHYEVANQEKKMIADEKCWRNHEEDSKLIAKIQCRQKAEDFHCKTYNAN